MKRALKGLYLETISWPEAENAFKKFETVVIPVGAATKEHGFHLPLNNDALIASYLTRRVLENCEVIAAPLVPYGFYPAFVDYPGSINIRLEVFRDLIVDICRSLARHGIKKFYVLNTGISTNRPLKAAQEILTEEGLRFAFTDLHETAVKAREEVKTQPLGTHADEIETSMMLYLAPESVRLERAQPELNPNRPGGLTRDAKALTGVYSPSGAWGDPTLATREKGKIVVEALVEEISTFLRNY